MLHLLYNRKRESKSERKREAGGEKGKREKTKTVKDIYDYNMETALIIVIYSFFK